MNQQVAKNIRRYAKMMGLTYEQMKKTYDKADSKTQEIYRQEMDQVFNGVKTPQEIKEAYQKGLSKN